MSSIVSFPIEQFRQDEDLQWLSHSVDDQVICEEPLEIWLKVLSTQANPPQQLLILMRTPGDDINLVTGWLYTSGIINSLAQIHSIHHTGQGRLQKGTSNQMLVTLVAGANIDLAQQQRHEYANSACGVCGQQSIEQLLSRLDSVPHHSKTVTPLPVSAMTRVTHNLIAHQPLFQQTGGNHGVALFNTKLDIVDVREDVGRHNALDKIIGANAAVLLSQEPATASRPIGLVLSGRVGFEMIQKAAMVKMSFVLAFGAPSSLAIELAKETDITLLGFVKNYGFNVYCNRHLLVP